MTNRLDNIVVVGQGAMGLLWYHHLSENNIALSASANTNINNKVTLLASNQESLSSSELKTTRYQFTPYEQNHVINQPLIYSNQTDIKSADIILLCLKSFHIVSAIKKIAEDIPLHCIVILAHNGLGTFKPVAKLLPNKQVIVAMLTTHGSFRSNPLTITHTGLGQTDIGLLSGELSSLQQEQLTSQLNSALPQVCFHQDIKKKQWFKLAINCVINPITAINNIDNGEVNDKKFSKQINLLLTEIIELSQVENIGLILTDLQAMVYQVALATAKNCSSMRSDILADRSTEIDYINGYIHHLGKNNNVATPENTRLWQQVLKLKDSARN